MVRAATLLLAVVLFSAPALAEDYHALGASYRFLGLPDFLVSPAFEAFQPVMAHGASLVWSRGQWDSFWSVGLAWGGTMIQPGFWQASDAEAQTAVWVEYDVGFLGGYAAYTWRFSIWEGLYFAPSVGLGVAGVIGEIHATEVIPGCEGDVHDCGHWRNVTRHPLDFSSRTMPLVLLTGQLGYRILDALHVGLDFGLVNLPFVGLSVDYAL
jgi:hypothetical protein